MARDKKNEEMKEEEVVETTEETTPEKSELDLANERADEFENKYLRAHAEMQNVRVADSRESCLADLAVISSEFLIPYRGFGILAIIGPVNLDYQQLVNQVSVVNRVLTMKLTDFYRCLSSNHYEVH